MKPFEFFLTSCRVSGCDLVFPEGNKDAAVTASMLTLCGHMLTVKNAVNGAIYTEEMPDFAFPEEAFCDAGSV